MAMAADVRAGDWMCPSCGNHNFASRQACNKCGGPRPEGGGSMPVANRSGMHMANTMAMMPPTGSMMPRAGSSMRAGDWMCNQCGNHNFASRQACNKCGIPREEGEAGGYGAAPAGGRQFDTPYSRACSSPAMARPTPTRKGELAFGPATPALRTGSTAGSDSPAEMREGDWICPECGNHNYASRVKCGKCNAVKEGMKDGDWICRLCNNHNYASRMVCYKCGAHQAQATGGCKGGGGVIGPNGMVMFPGFPGGKGGCLPAGGFGMPGANGSAFGGKGGSLPGYGPGFGMKSGDWMCPGCGNHNYASRVKCNKCERIRPGMKDGDWICPSCKNHNFASRVDNCNKCGAPKPDIP